MGVNMLRCDKCGSFYNSSATPACPYCNGESTARDYADVTEPASAAIDAGRTQPLSVSTSDDRTTPVFSLEDGTNPVVGWLIGTAGKEKGRDHRLHADNNFIGRSEKMDVCLRGDDTISRENHCVIAYDSREKIFLISPGTGRSIVRVNGKAMMAPLELNAYDRVEIGQTELVFIPLCGPQFDWEG